MSNLVVCVEDGRGPTMVRTTTENGTLAIEELGPDGNAEIVVAGSIGSVIGAVRAVSQVRDLLAAKSRSIPAGAGGNCLTPTEQAILDVVLGAM